ncbi:hypothetical protein [Rhizobium terrae]|uniref:hypothetical protein n=1 Tax=Rhizobium terrae TaxID=2171756 RepID=UPI0013C2C602|nr:hypothetical protein [Rhizobium terrae]
MQGRFLLLELPDMTDKRMPARESPQSAAAYTGSGETGQGNDFVAPKNRSSKFNCLVMWFYNTTIYRGGIE